MARTRGGGNNNNRGGNNNNRGGNNNNRGGKNNNNNRNNNNNNNSNDKGKNNNNNNNKNGKKKNNNQNQNQNQNRNQNQNQNKTTQCRRCEKYGHLESSCNAKEVPEQSRCPCGNAFHYQNHCPFEGDPFTRDEQIAQATGLFCTWCKDAGDGRHSFDDCTIAKQFKVDIARIQRNAYDNLEFCWHCRDVNHKSYACKGNQAMIDRELWVAKISEVMDKWKTYSNSVFRSAYRDNEMDVYMDGMQDRRSPPVAASFQWCLFCEMFGHVIGEKVGGCDMTKFENRAPIEAKSQVIPRRPFVPQGFQTQSSNNSFGFGAGGSGAGGFGAGGFGGASIQYTVCPTYSCGRMLGPWTFPRPPMGQSYFCKSCGASVQHPHTPQPGHQIDAIQGINNFIQLLSHSTTPKVNIAPDILAMYEKRPSLKLIWSLAHRQKLASLNERDTIRYRYSDGSGQGAWSPVMWQDGRYFNGDWQGGGNYQEYFPAITFQITDAMWADAKNSSAPINLIGKTGLTPMCTMCFAPILVLDDEDDVVMCGTAWTNTLGEGTGKGYYKRADGTYDLSRCDCLWMIGQKGDVGWMDPTTGTWARH